MKSFLQRMVCLSCLVFFFGFSPTLQSSHAQANQADTDTDAGQLRQLIESYWQFRMMDDPLFASECGHHEFGDKLPDVSLASQQPRLEKFKQFRDQLKNVDKGKLSIADATNCEVLRFELNKQVAEQEFETYLIPITNREGFHISFPQLASNTRFETYEDYERFVKRLSHFRVFAAQHIELMTRGMEQGKTLPSIVLEGFDELIEPHVSGDIEKMSLFEPFTKLPAGFSAEQKGNLIAGAKKHIEESVVPGFEEFGRFMKDKYIPAARGTIATSAMKDGREFYRHRVKLFTTLDMTPLEVHETGKREVARIRNEMQKVIESTDFEGDFAEFLEFLRTDERFYPKTNVELMKEVAYSLKKIDGELPKLFRTLPRTPYGIQEIPLFVAPRTTAAYYQPPPGDGSRGGFYFVNTFNLKSRPLFDIEALSMHEAVPGHHLQIALQQEMTDLPEFRRFAMFTAYTEGWALYSERLGLEMGFYKDPYSNFGRLSYEMWRACRLVVDTGIHYFDWSRKDAIDFMAENTSLSIHNITAEVDRYISWPGQALGYKIGELKIRELRKMAEQELGSNFDIRDFHDAVLLQGGVPLNVLEHNVERYIVDRKVASKAAADSRSTSPK